MKKDRLFQKNWQQKIFDFIFLPARIILPDDKVEKRNLTSLRQERFNICLEYSSGKVLDIGCCTNEFIRAYRIKNNNKSVGVDAFKWEGADIVCDTSKLPFKDNCFNTVTIIASLNHIPKRDKVLKEAFRVLAPNGKILITMINPLISQISHQFVRRRFDYDQNERGGMKKGEVFGFWTSEVYNLLHRAGFRKLRKIPFVYGFNNLYIGYKK